MSAEPDDRHRRSLRLAGYDYASAGAYFVTVCVSGRACLFGEIVDHEMSSNEVAEAVHDACCAIAERF